MPFSFWLVEFNPMKARIRPQLFDVTIDTVRQNFQRFNGGDIVEEIFPLRRPIADNVQIPTWRLDVLVLPLQIDPQTRISAITVGFAEMNTTLDVQSVALGHFGWVPFFGAAFDNGNIQPFTTQSTRYYSLQA